MHPDYCPKAHIHKLMLSNTHPPHHSISYMHRTICVFTLSHVHKVQIHGKGGRKYCIIQLTPEGSWCGLKFKSIICEVVSPIAMAMAEVLLCSFCSWGRLRIAFSWLACKCILPSFFHVTFTSGPGSFPSPPSACTTGSCKANKKVRHESTKMITNKLYASFDFPFHWT